MKEKRMSSLSRQPRSFDGILRSRRQAPAFVGLRCSIRTVLLTAALLLALPAVAAAQRLTGHWTFDGNQFDSSGMNNHIRQSGASTYARGRDEHGKASQALDLRGGGSYFVIPNSPSLQTDAFSVSYWVYMSTPQSYMPLVSKGTVPGSAAWQTSIVAGLDAEGRSVGGQSLQFCVSGTCRTSAALTQDPVGRWMEVTLSYDGTTATGYADGIAVLTFAGSFSPGNSTADIQIGNSSSNSGSDFHGLMRDLRIYDGAMTPSVQALVVSGASLGASAITLGSAATSASVLLNAPGAWTAAANNSFLHVAPASASGSGNALVLFSIDAFNSTGSRTGTLTIAGLTLNVTQAGTNYTATTAAMPAGSLGTSGTLDAAVPAIQGTSFGVGTTVAADSAGNLYGAGDVIKLSCDAFGLNCNTSVTDRLLTKMDAVTKAVTTLGSGLKGPGMAAVDSAGNVYVADSGNNAIKKWTASTQQFTTLISGLSAPRGVAVDSAGDLYIANTGNYEIKKWTAATQQVTTLISGLRYVPGVAVDVAGNVYFSESDTPVSNRTFKGLCQVGTQNGIYNYNCYTATGTDHGTIKKWTPSTQQVTALVSLNHPYELDVDGSGNLYFMDADYSKLAYSTTGDFPHRAGKWNAATQQVTLLPTSAAQGNGSFPLNGGIGVDGAGNVYLTGYGYDAAFRVPYALVPSGTINEPISAGTDALPPVLPVTTDLTGNAPQSDQSWLTLGAVAGGVVPFSYAVNTTGSPRTAHISILGVQSTITQDRTTVPNIAGQTQAAANTAIAGVSLTVGNVYTAVSATVPAGRVISTNPLAGTQLVMGSRVDMIISSGAAALGAEAIQVDSSAATYSVILSAAAPWTATASSPFLHLASGSASGTVSSLVTFTVDAFTSTGSRTGTLTIAGLTFTVTQWGTSYQRIQQRTTLVTAQPYLSRGVAVDSSGNVLVINLSNKSVDQWVAATQPLTSLVSGLNAPSGLARDDSSNIYVADTGTNSIKVRNAVTGAVTTVLSGLNAPRGLSVDKAGDLYFAETGSNTVKKWSQATGAVSTLVSGLNQPYAVSVDRAGNLYITDTGNNVIKMWSIVSGAVTTLVSGLSAPNGVAVDGFGNLYLTDNGGLKRWNVTTGVVETLDARGGQPAESVATAVAVDAAGTGVYAEFNAANGYYNYPALVKYLIAIQPVVTVPNVTGLAQSAATTAITAAGLTVGTSTSVVSTTVPVGAVVSTSPAAGTTVVAGSAVDLTVSGQSAAMPNVVGLTEAAAYTAVRNVGLLPGTAATSYSATIPAGIVLGQNPAANTLLLVNSVVHYTVSLGPVPVTMPNVIGQTQAAATTAVTAAGLVVSAVSTAVSPAGSVSPGTVLSTNPAPGAQAPTGGTVSLVIEAGPVGLSGSNLLVGSAAASSSVFLNVRDTFGPWIATANDSFLHLAAGSSAGTGNARIAFTVDAFSSTGIRTGTLTIAGRTFTITQLGTDYVPSLQPTTQTPGGYILPDAVAVDGFGDVYIADTGNDVIKKWSAATQQVSTLISTGLNNPHAVAVDGSGNLYTGDVGGLKRWTPITQQFTTLDFTGEVYGIALDGSGNIYFTQGASTVRKWTASTQQTTTLISSGLSSPRGIAVDSAGNLYIADAQNAAIKTWNATTQQMTSLISTGLANPWGIAVDASGDVYLADGRNTAVKKWSAATQQVTTLFTEYVAGVTNRYRGLALDASGNLYFAETDAKLVGQLSKVYVPSGSLNEPNTAGSGALPPVMPVTASLAGAFAPTSDQPWLTIGTVANGIVNFSFTANATGSSRTGHITISGVPFTIIQGSQQTAVPDVTGQPQASAATAITSAGLLVGTVTTTSSSTVAAGSVISTDPTAATPVNAGSAVNLVISTGPAQVAVPNVVGQTQAAATTAITAVGLVVGTVTTASSGTVNAGNVISTNPAAGIQVSLASAVNMVVSSGPPQVGVPNVIGQPQAAATTSITAAGLVLGTITSASSSTVAAGSVISTSPAAAAQVNLGSAVNLVVSTGPAQVAVPNVVGQTQTAAATAITGAGLAVGTVTTASSGTVVAGNVISTNPAAATQVNLGSAVNLVVSTGPSTPTVTATGNACTYNAFVCAGSGAAIGVNNELLTPVLLTYTGTNSTTYGPSTMAPANAGTYSMTASFAGNANYTSGTSTPVAITINSASQIITFAQPAGPATYGSTFAVLPTATSGLAVAVQVSGGCSISAGTVTMTSGTTACVLTASQAGNNNYNPAASVTVTVAANLATLTITPDGSKLKTFGSGFTGFTGQVTGLKFTDAVTPAYSSVGAAANAPAGSYDITVAQYTFTSSSAAGNYRVITNTAVKGLSVAPYGEVVATSVTPNEQIYTGNIIFSATIPATLIGGENAATSASFYICPQNTAAAPTAACQNMTPTAVPFVPDGKGGLTLTTATIPLLETVPGALAPGAHTIMTILGGTGADYLLTVPAASLTIDPKPAAAVNNVYYTGSGLFWTPNSNSNTATLVLTATLQDGCKLLPLANSYCGDVAKSKVTFAIRNQDGTTTPITGATNLPVGYVNAGDTTVGSAAVTVQYNVPGGANSAQLPIAVLVNGYYAANDPSMDAEISISKAIIGNETKFVGTQFKNVAFAPAIAVNGCSATKPCNQAGTLVGASGATTYAQGDLTYTNKATNPQGQVMITLDSHYDASTGKTDPNASFTYHIKTNSISGLSISNGTATFTAKGSIQEIFAAAPAFGVDGGAIVQIVVTQPPATSPGPGLISVQVNDSKTGGIWFSSAWNGTTTVAQPATAGQILVN